MDQAAIEAAMQRWEAQGKAPSLGNLRRELGNKGSWRDIVKWKRALLGNGTAGEVEMTMTMKGFQERAADNGTCCIIR